MEIEILNTETEEIYTTGKSSLRVIPEKIIHRFMVRKHFSEAVKEKMIAEMSSEKRHIGLREFARQIWVSPATLSRIINFKPPDIETFFKICFWMKRSGDEFCN